MSTPIEVPTLPFSIYLAAPYLAVSQDIYSIYNVTLANPQGPYTFGYIRQVNYNTIGFNNGDRIMYLQQQSDPIIYMNNQPYALIDEKKVFFVEPLTPIT